ANAGHRPRLDGQSARVADGRTVGRLGAADRRRGDDHHPPAEGEWSVDRAGGAKPEARLRHRRRHRHPQQRARCHCRERGRAAPGRGRSPAASRSLLIMWNKYAPTAARRHGRPGREQRPQSITIDVHSHVAVPRAAEFVKPHIDLSAIPLAHFATSDTKALNQRQEADRRSRMTGYDERLADLDAMGIDLQLVCPPPAQCYTTLPLDITVSAVRMVNDGVAEYIARRPDRF